MKYPHKEDLFRVLNKEIEFNEFLNIFSEVNNFDKEHPVFNMIYYVKDILEKNSNEMLNSKIDGGTLCSAMNLKLDEIYSEMKSYSSNSDRMGEKDSYEISELEIGYKFCKDLIDKICYAYSENY